MLSKSAKAIVWLSAFALLFVAGVALAQRRGRQDSDSGHHGGEATADHGGSEHHHTGEEHHDDQNGPPHHEGEPEFRHHPLSGRLVRLVEVSAERFQFEPSRITVREGETVLLAVTSRDVTHGIGIKEYGVDRKLKPGQTQWILFTASKSGEFHLHCSVRCGAGHERMHGELVVLEKPAEHEEEHHEAGHEEPEGHHHPDADTSPGGHEEGGHHGEGARANEANPGDLPAYANRYCPSMPDEKVDPALFVEYQGKKIFVCCQKCRRRVARSPEAWYRKVYGDFE